jgi:hypothetical protein
MDDPLDVASQIEYKNIIMDASNDTPKKEYTSPVLKVYGDIREITQIRASGAQFDNNSMRAKTT